VSILKLFVMFSSGLSSVCHFGHDGEILGVIPRSGTRCGRPELQQLNDIGRSHHSAVQMRSNQRRLDNDKNTNPSSGERQPQKTEVRPYRHDVPDDTRTSAQ
jgi:hypothetical protein